MPRGRVLRWSVAAAALLAAGAAALTGRTGYAGAYGSGIYSFPHEPHISAATVNAGLAEAAAMDRGGRRPGGGGKADAECRVCHDYEKGREAHLEDRACFAQCHVAKKHLTVATQPGSSSSSTFPHREHLKDPTITCFSCHRVQKELGWLEFTLPEGGLGRVGAGGKPGGKQGDPTCADCHHTHEPQGGVVKQDEKTGDGKACAECHLDAKTIEPRNLRGLGPAGAAQSQQPFRHADHGAAGADCSHCHAAIETSKTIWDYDPTAGTRDACVQCHVDAAGKPLTGIGTPPKTTKLPFVLFSRFPHETHLKPPAGKVETSGKVNPAPDKQCQTCHFPESDAASAKLFPARRASNEPLGRAELVDYDACTPCHAAWKVEGHGVGEWTCFKCHAGGLNAKGDGLRVAQSAVRRETLGGGVKFAKMHHPEIASASTHPISDKKQPAGAGAARECRDCHVGEISAIPSKLTGKVFAHDPHVTAEPTNAECIECHTSSAEVSWSADLKRFDTHVTKPPTASGAKSPARGCLDCHEGATAADLGADLLNRTVPEFDHKGHVVGAKWKGALGVPCAECHTPGGPAGYTTAPDVLSCVRCHSHDPAATEKFARTGKKTSEPESVKNCTACHEDVREMASPSTAKERTHLSLLPGRQHHDKAGDCASCHARENRPYAYTERIKKAEVKASVHEDQALANEWFNNPAIAKPGADPQGRTCMTCHRTEPRGYLRALDK